MCGGEWSAGAWQIGYNMSMTSACLLYVFYFCIYKIVWYTYAIDHTFGMCVVIIICIPVWSEVSFSAGGRLGGV